MQSSDRAQHAVEAEHTLFCLNTPGSAFDVALQSMTQQAVGECNPNKASDLHVVIVSKQTNN